MKRITLNDSDYIKAIEKVNRERINSQYDEKIIYKKRICKIISEIVNLRFDKILSHVSVRLRKRISSSPTSKNLEIEEEKKLAVLGDNSIRVAIYSCITGGYDSPMEPFVKFPNSDYYIVSDVAAYKGWDVIPLNDVILDKYGLSMANRYVKFNPDIFFSGNYDYAIYIDGNITPVSDLSTLICLVNKDIGLAFHKHCSRTKLSEEYIACVNVGKGNKKGLKEQVKQYLSEGLPDNYGLVEGNFYICDLRNKNGLELLHQCWAELQQSKGGRDQIVWPYILWKRGIRISDIATLGANVWKNVKIYINRHN